MAYSIKGEAIFSRTLSIVGSATLGSSFRMTMPETGMQQGNFQNFREFRISAGYRFNPPGFLGDSDTEFHPYTKRLGLISVGYRSTQRVADNTFIAINGMEVAIQSNSKIGMFLLNLGGYVMPISGIAGSTVGNYESRFNFGFEGGAGIEISQYLGFMFVLRSDYFSYVIGGNAYSWNNGFYGIALRTLF